MATETPGDRIAALRHKVARDRGLRRYTQAALAKDVGVSKSAVTAWEGDTQLPTGRNLARLAAALRTSATYILEGESARVIIPEPEEPGRAAPGAGRGGSPNLDPEGVLKQLRATAEKEQDPAEAKALMLDYLDAVEEIYVTHDGRKPGWLARLKKEVERGEFR